MGRCSRRQTPAGSRIESSFSVFFILVSRPILVNIPSSSSLRLLSFLSLSVCEFSLPLPSHLGRKLYHPRHHRQPEYKRSHAFTGLQCQRNPASSSIWPLSPALHCYLAAFEVALVPSTISRVYSNSCFSHARRPLFSQFFFVLTIHLLNLLVILGHLSQFAPAGKWSSCCLQQISFSPR